MPADKYGMRYAVASLWAVATFFFLLVAAAFGALSDLGRFAFWIFVLDVVAVLGLAVMGLVAVSPVEARVDRRRTITISISTLVFGLGAGFMLYVVSHIKLEM